MDFHSGDWSTAWSEATKPHLGQRISPFSKSPISISLQLGHSIIEPVRVPPPFLIGFNSNYILFSILAFSWSTGPIGRVSPAEHVRLTPFVASELIELFAAS